MKYHFSVVGATASLLLAVAAPVAGIPTNDQCEFAEAVMIGGSAAGSNVGATPVTESDLIGPLCGDLGFSDLENVVWYTVDGDGSTFEAATCRARGDSRSYDTVLAVFSGDCNNLVCVAGNDDGDGLTCTGSDDSVVTWGTNPGTKYYVLVSGYSGGTGDFLLSLSNFPLPANDECQFAEPVEVGGSAPGSTVGATSDLSVPSCGDLDPPDLEYGVWYTVEGDGSIFEAATCVSTSDTVIAVYTSTSTSTDPSTVCGNLECVDGTEYGEGIACPNYYGSSVIWSTFPGTTYYILVSGGSSGHNGGRGNFLLSVSSYARVANDKCTGAQGVAVGSLTSGSTAVGTYPFDPPNSDDCEIYNGLDEDSRGVWYTVQGDDSFLEAAFFCGGIDTSSSDSDEGRFDRVLAVYRGTCGSLECVEANEIDGEDCDDGRIRWNAVSTETYYILVVGQDEDENGLFTLALSSFTPTANNECNGAQEVKVGSFTAGSTDLAMRDLNIDVSSCDQGSGSDSFDDAAYGVWYTVVGDGAPIQAFTSQTNFDASIFAFTGDDCDNLVCVDDIPTKRYSGYTSRYSDSVRWNSDVNTRYYILVAGQPVSYSSSYSSKSVKAAERSTGVGQFSLAVLSATESPTRTPSLFPSEFPPSSEEASGYPSSNPSGYPSSNPSGYPSSNPSGYPSLFPSEFPSSSEEASGYPSSNPSGYPSSNPSGYPSSNPSEAKEGKKAKGPKKAKRKV